MSGIIEPPKIIVKTLEINSYKYILYNLIPHTSVQYGIDCFQDATLVTSITGIIEGEQYKEWMTDDWLDRFIKQKVEELPDVERCVEPVPIEPEVLTESTIVDPVPADPPIVEPEVLTESTIVDPVPVEPIVEPV